MNSLTKADITHIEQYNAAPPREVWKYAVNFCSQPTAEAWIYIMNTKLGQGSGPAWTKSPLITHVWIIFGILFDWCECFIFTQSVTAFSPLFSPTCRWTDLIVAYPHILLYCRWLHALNEPLLPHGTSSEQTAHENLQNLTHHFPVWAKHWAQDQMLC